MTGLQAGIVRSLASGEFSDLTITCGDYVHRVHKLVLCPQSDFFTAAVRFGGKVENANIDLSDDDPEIVKFLIKYLYTGEYGSDVQDVLTDSTPDSTWKGRPQANDWEMPYLYEFPHSCDGDKGDCWQYSICPHHKCNQDCLLSCCNLVCKGCTRMYPSASGNDLLIHSKMYEIADKYHITGLKELSRECVALECIVSWDDEAFAIAAHHVFSTTMEEDKGLRGIVIETIAEHTEIVRKESIQELMKEFDQLPIEVLLHNAPGQVWE